MKQIYVTLAKTKIKSLLFVKILYGYLTVHVTCGLAKYEIVFSILNSNQVKKLELLIEIIRLRFVQYIEIMHIYFLKRNLL